MTSLLFQPFAFAAGSRAASIDGFVLSIQHLCDGSWRCCRRCRLRFLSTDWLAPSSETTSFGAQLAIPERPSVQSKWIVTSMLFQPFAFASGLCEKLIEGAVLSTLTSILFFASAFPALSTLQYSSV